MEAAQMANEPKAPPDPFEGIPTDELPTQELRRRALDFVNEVRIHYYLPRLEDLIPGRRGAVTLNPICTSIRHNADSMRAQIIDGGLLVGEARRGFWQKETSALPEAVTWFLQAHAEGNYPDLLSPTGQ